MKMDRTYFDALQAVIREYDTAEWRSRYLAGDFPNSDSVKDLDQRYRWDQFWNATRLLSAAGTSYPNELNDAHIYTALRRMIPPLAS